VRVADAGALVAALTDGLPLNDSARRAISRGPVISPEIVDVEVCSALRHLVNGGRVSVELAERSLQRLTRLPLERHGHAALIRRCWELRHTITPYDAVYVALAEALAVPLVTTDARLARASGPRCAFEVLGGSAEDA
jgi:predicted nucleic acid-binding protein